MPGNANYTEKTSIPFPFKLNGTWSWWQFSFQWKFNGNIVFSLKSELSHSSWRAKFNFSNSIDWIEFQFIVILGMQNLIFFSLSHSSWRAKFQFGARESQGLGFEHQQNVRPDGQQEQPQQRSAGKDRLQRGAFLALNFFFNQHSLKKVEVFPK